MKAKKVKKEKRHFCNHCRHLFPESEIIFDVDPYAHDIGGDDTKVWECKPCREISAWEI